MGWASFLEDLEKVRDDLRHLGERVGAKSLARLPKKKSPVPAPVAKKRNKSKSADAADGFEAELSELTTNLVNLEGRLNALLDVATDPSIGIAVEAERALAAAGKAKEETKLIARKALKKSDRRKQALANTESIAAQLREENYGLKVELAKLMVSGETSELQRENKKLEGRVRRLQEMLSKRG